MDKGLRFILECCRALFNYASKRRHLSPYAENPFRTIEIDRIPIEQVRSVILFTPDQERAFFDACDDWQLPLFLTLALTGLRPGELCHLLLPDDVDLNAGWLRVRNKPQLGWQVKTRNEREVPLVPILARVLRVQLTDRPSGPAFIRRPSMLQIPPFDMLGSKPLECEIRRRVADIAGRHGASIGRPEGLRVARGVWRDAGAIRPEWIRIEFIQLTQAIGLPGQTAPKLLRHQFATALQEGRVDPLVRNLLMGHAPCDMRAPVPGLGMTAVYTHTRSETLRDQLECALTGCPAALAAEAWLGRCSRIPTSERPGPRADAWDFGPTR
jgi:integrase